MVDFIFNKKYNRNCSFLIYIIIYRERSFEANKSFFGGKKPNEYDKNLTKKRAAV